MNTHLILAFALVGCSKADNHHTLGSADAFKLHLQEHACKEARPLGGYQHWFECVREVLPCGCNVRITIFASDVDGSSKFLVDGVDATVRGCPAAAGFTETYDLLDPLFPLAYRGAIHAFIRIPGQPAEGSPNPASAVIQFARFPGVSLSAMQRVDTSRAELEVSVNHTERYKAPAFLDDPGPPLGCQR
jgi:hypothetical protein